MQRIRIILSSNSNKLLDNLSQNIIRIGKETNTVMLGPICFKGKRMIDLYHTNIKTIDRLITLKQSKRVDVNILVGDEIPQK